MKDNKSLLLILLAAGLVSTWGYHIYDKSRYSNKSAEIILKDSLSKAETENDSLNAEYKRALDSISAEKIKAALAIDTLRNSGEQNIEEIKRLRQEIKAILEKKYFTQADLNETNAKIKLLQIRSDSLLMENSSLVEKNKSLSKALAQSPGGINTEETTNGKAVTEKIPSLNIGFSSPFQVSRIRFAALGNKNGQKDKVTRLQENAQKFICSFTLQNNKSDFPNTEIYIVIANPEGKSVNTEVWDAGSFDTRSEGKKVFTRKLKFDYRQGEIKKISLTVQPDGFKEGLYKMGIYYKGIRIGESSWKLN